MSLHDFNEALLRLYTHRPALRAFQNDPLAFLSEYSLTERERTAIMNIPHAGLEEIQDEVLTKRMNRAHKLVRLPNRMVAIPFHADGGPLALWGELPQQIEIGPGVFFLLHELWLQQRPLTFSALTRSYKSSMHPITLRDLFSLACLMYCLPLRGKFVTAR